MISNDSNFTNYHGINWKAAAAASGILAVGSLGTLVWCWAKNGRKAHVRPERWIKVGNVRQLIIYPIKSCKGRNVDSAIATPVGLKATQNTSLRDRIFMVVDENGELVRNADVPKMVLVENDIIGNEVILSAPDAPMITFNVPDDHSAIRRKCKMWGEVIPNTLDCGPEVNRWLSQYLSKEVYLCYHIGDTTQRKQLADWQSRFSMFSSEDKGTFQDTTSYMVTSQESLDELNSGLQNPVDHISFRPSIVVEGIAQPFDEEKWGFIKIGEEGPAFKVAMPCLRCKSTIVDPGTGTYDKHGEPLKTLHKMKRKVWDAQVSEMCKKDAVFGINFGLYAPGEAIRVNDPVYAAVL